MAEIVMPDGEGGDGRGDGRADADTVADTIAARESAAHRRMPTWQPSVTPERWLHSDTVEDVRARQARQGLPTPRALPPELTDPRLATASGAKQPGAVAAGRYVLTSMLAILLGLLVGAIAAVIVFAASAPTPGR